MNARFAVTLLAWSGYFLMWAAVVPQLWWYRTRREPWRPWQVWCAGIAVVLQFVYWFMHGWPLSGPTWHWLDAFNR